MNTTKKLPLGDLFSRAGLTVPAHCPDVMIGGLRDDSRKVEPGDLFVATPGTRTDSHAFVNDAIAKGAAAVVVDQEFSGEISQTAVRVPDSREALGRLAHAFRGNPSGEMLVIGVTGTNGKTTTTYLLESILQAAGYEPGVIGTIEYRFRGQRREASNTTPSAVQLSGLFSEMHDAGVNAVAMEVSSHAIDQRRIAGIEFDAGILTNITQDHLDYHKTMEAYASAKKRFFLDHLLRAGCDKRKRAPVAAFNVDDAYGREFRLAFPGTALGYGTGQDADVRSDVVRFAPDATLFELHAPGRVLPVRTSLLGLFNVSNILGAASACMVLGIKDSAIIEGIQSLPVVRGRFEQVIAGQPFHVIVDYAHTPDALERVLSNARHMTSGRIIAVFGCGGDRDKAKRPIMGRVVGDMSDYAVITNDNPRTENAEDIAAMALEGVRSSRLPAARTQVILDRRQAIAHAIELAGPGDLVLIAGKGHEDYQIVGTEKLHFDDSEVARSILESKGHARSEASR